MKLTIVKLFGALSLFLFTNRSMAQQSQEVVVEGVFISVNETEAIGVITSGVLNNGQELRTRLKLAHNGSPEPITEQLKTRLSLVRNGSPEARIGINPGKKFIGVGLLSEEGEVTLQTYTIVN